VRISGRGGTETLLFIAPAALFGAFFIWVRGDDPSQLFTWLDRAVIHIANVVSDWLSAAVQALAG
jgi:hypothetical protein